MSNKRSHIGELFSIFGDAVAVAAAVRQGRQPAARNLRGLGIDPDQFNKIRRS